jgi:redox-sensitive bicupin YhaK (pirin superfamily)
MDITIFKSETRGKTEIEWLKSYHTFSFGHYFNRNRMNFGPLRVINDDYVAPQTGFDTHPHKNMEIITYVLSGELTHKDSLGTAEKLIPGEVQRMSAGTGIYHSEKNASNKEVHLLQIWIQPKTMDINPRYSQQKVQYTDDLSILVSRDGRNNSLQIEQDAEIYAVKIDSAKNITLPHTNSEIGWIHVIDGHCSLSNNFEVSDTLHNGDSAGFKNIEKSTLNCSDNFHGLVFVLPDS